MRRPFSFEKHFRITTGKEFNEVFNQQNKVVGRSIIVFFKRGPELKVGIIASRKVDKRAVKRNLMKRKIREVFRQNKPELIGKYVIIARSYCRDMTLKQVEEDFFKVLKKVERKHG